MLFLFAFVAYSAMQSQNNIHNIGTISTIGIGMYQDSGCTQNLTQINWGSLIAGNSISYTAYAKNLGNSPVTLTMTTANWNPSDAPNFLSLTWDYNGQTINQNQVVTVTFTLSSVNSTAYDFNSFGFDITIIATS
jgi:hypothetical protein